MNSRDRSMTNKGGFAPSEESHLILKESLNRVTNQLHASSHGEDMSWYNVCLMKQKGDSRFRCFNICQDICFTRSHYFGEDPLVSEACYPRDTTLMVFGLKGQSYFGFSEHSLNHQVRAGDIWLFNLKGKNLYRYSAPNCHHEMAVLKFPTKRLKKAFTSKDQSLLNILDNEASHIAIQQNNQEWIAPLCNNPLKTPFDRIKAEGRTLELFAHWLLPLGQSATTLDNTTEHIKGKVCPIKKARNILVAQLANPPSLHDLSKQVGMSHTRLNRDFKKKYGKTVFDWLRTYRLQLAKSYLQDKEQSITSIAHFCGFSSASHFTQAFRQYEGCTPVTYRTSKLNTELGHDH